MFVDLLASLAFYIVPYVTGRFFTKKVIQAWTLGALVWFILFFTAKFVSVLLGFNFSHSIKWIALLISTISVIKLLFTGVKKIFNIPLESFLILPIVLTMLTFIYFWIWKVTIPYPMQLNWDTYEHITLVNQIASGNISWFTTNISDTFTINSYSPMFGILLSIPKIIFQRSLLGMYWWLEYWHFMLTAIAAFLLAKKVFNNNFLSFMAAIISSLTFESLMAYTTLFLIPQTLTAVVAILALIEIEDSKPAWLIPIMFTIFLTHYIVGTLCTLLLLLVYLSKRLTISTKVLNVGIIAAIIFLLISIGLHLFGHWEVLAREEAKYFNFSLTEKADLLLQWYGLFLFIFLPFGTLRIIASQNQRLKLFLILTLIVLAVSLAPFSYFLKFYVLSHYFINIIIIAGIDGLLLYLPTYFKGIGASLLLVVCMAIFHINQLLFKELLFFRNFTTNVSFKEIEAAKWLSNYRNAQEAFLISDPGLQYILEAESGINSSGGAYMTLENRLLLPEISSSSNPGVVRNTLLKIKDRLDKGEDREVLFVTGGRYFAWQRLPQRQKESIFYNIWKPAIIREQDRQAIHLLKQSVEFDPLYENEELVVLRVR